MSTPTPPSQHHHRTQSAALPVASVASYTQNPLNPHHLNNQAHSSNSASKMDYSQQHSTPPRTPQKGKTDNARGGVAVIAESASKPRSKGKNRPKNVMNTPATSMNDRSTPPLPRASTTAVPISSKAISTPSAAAYAGPTFHASPAPSALPIPSFYSKSVPDSPSVKDSPSKRMDISSDSGGDSPTPPANPGLAAKNLRHESPLDLFFKADREEKARARSSNSNQGSRSESGPFAPPSESPQHGYTTPSATGQGGVPGGLFAMELDGMSSPGKPYGPAFSTPYSERINAARSSNSSLPSPSQTTATKYVSDTKSEALKAYLFSGAKPSSTSSQPSLVRPTENGTTPLSAPFRNISSPAVSSKKAGLHSRPQHSSFPFIHDPSLMPSPRTGSRSSGLRQEVTPTKTPNITPERLDITRQTPSTPSKLFENANTNVKNPARSSSTSNIMSSGASHSQPADLKKIEDGLRQILKLDPVARPDAHHSEYTKFPAVPISGYAVGRPA